MTRMEMAKEYLETVKKAVNEAIESGNYATIGPDSEGITPQTRLEWVIPSIDYINSVAENYSTESINDELRTQRFDERRTLAFYYVGIVEKFSHDQYVSEGYRNITNALKLMADIAVEEKKEEADYSKDDVRRLRKEIRILESKANTARQRAEKAEARVSELRAMLRHLGVDT